MVAIFLRFSRLGDPEGSQTRENRAWFSAFSASGTNLLDRAVSWLRNISLATSGDDMTIVVLLPSLRDIKGPYVLESVATASCGLSPSSWMLPMIGHGFGPGGSLDFLNDDFRMKMARRIVVRRSRGVV